MNDMAKKTKEKEVKERLAENAKDKILIDNAEYVTHYTTKYANKTKYEPKNPKKILSFMPGTVLNIEAKAGDKVKKGDFILILEAMKMKNRIFAERDGVIKKIHVNAGDRIPKNTLLVEMK